MTDDKIKKLEYQNKFLREHIREVQSRFEEKIAELSMASEIGMALFHISSFSEVCQIILDVIIKNTISQNCSIMLMDYEKDSLFLVAATDPAKNNFILDGKNVLSKEGVHYYFKTGQGIAGHAILKKRPILIQSTKRSSSFTTSPKSLIKIGSLLSIPLIIEGKPFGVLNLSHENLNAFKPNDINFLKIIANFISLSLYSALNYERLQYSEEKYRALSESSNDGISIIENGVSVYANKKYQDMTGYNLHELKNIPFQNLLDKSYKPKSIDYVNSLLGFKAPPTQFETKIISKDNKKMYVEINSSIIFYNYRKAVILSVRDITDRKTMEKKLQQAEKMEAIGELAGGVAHDLNNILSGIVGYPELLLMDMPKDSPMRKSIILMQKSGEKASSIVQDLLILARNDISTSKEISLNKIILDYMGSNEYQKLKLYYPNIHIDKDLQSHLWEIMGSDVTLLKTLVNLISNAADSISDKGMIIISTKNIHLENSIKAYEYIEKGDYVVLTVSDSGEGFSQTHLEKIFEPFYIKKALGKTKSGLGMAVVWGTVKDHNGYIDIKSTQGKGTSLMLYFPAHKKNQPINSYTFSFDNFKGKGESVLIVDDVDDQREIASEILKKLGYSVISESSGERAVDYLKNNSVDLIVLDMIMDPGIDGLETYKRILKFKPHQKAIIASGFSETEKVVEAQRLGVGSFIKKPYSVESLGKAIRREIDIK